MNKFQLFLCLVFLVSNISVSSAQDVPNGNMEYWSPISDSNKEHPEGWISRNQLDDTPQANYCLKVNDAFKGDYAVMLQNYQPAPSISLGSFMSLGSFNPADPNHSGVAFTGRPISLNFAYKYFTTKANPSGFYFSKASIKLTRWDEDFNASVVVGEAEFTIVHKANNYEEVVLPLFYYEGSTPDSLFLTFSTPSNPNDQVRLTLDDIYLRFHTPVGTDDVLDFDKISLYPNPVSDNLNVFNPQLLEETEIIIFDALGKAQIFSDVSSQNQQIDVANLDTGFYFYQIRHKNELVKTGKFLKTAY